jgi:hypothetical protein
MSKINKNNFKKILHFRNIYAFLANVADLIIQESEELFHEIASYVLIQKILDMIVWLKEVI